MSSIFYQGLTVSLDEVEASLNGGAYTGVPPPLESSTGSNGSCFSICLTGEVSLDTLVEAEPSV